VLAAALAEMVKDAGMRERMGRRGEEIFRSKFRLEDTIQRFRDLYLSL
jgi:glycosyltransferase involved in cell wall biosynthesis